MQGGEGNSRFKEAGRHRLVHEKEMPKMPLSYTERNTQEERKQGGITGEIQTGVLLRRALTMNSPDKDEAF